MISQSSRSLFFRPEVWQSAKKSAAQRINEPNAQDVSLQMEQVKDPNISTWNSRTLYNLWWRATQKGIFEPYLDSFFNGKMTPERNFPHTQNSRVLKIGNVFQIMFFVKGMQAFKPWRHLKGARPPDFKSWDIDPKHFSHGLGSFQVHFEPNKIGIVNMTSEPQSKIRLKSLKNGHFFMRKMRFIRFFQGRN